MPPKVNTSTGAAAATAVVVVWAFSLAGIVIPADVAVTIAAGLVWAAGIVAARLGVKAAAKAEALSANDYRERNGLPRIPEESE